jgi:ribosomal RNA-processing protein 9
MPDAFFVNSKKRKRGLSSTNGPLKKSKASTSQSRKGRRDEELSASGSDGGGIDDMDLRAEEIDEHASGDEDLEETVAEKRLRLAKLYLEGVKNELGKHQPTLQGEACVSITHFSGRRV